jgi:phosphoribosylformylglycinamidine cyclo-ligase
MSKAYEQAGVNLEAGYESVERIKKHIAKTNRLGVMSAIGGFGGMFDLSALDYKEPVLVSGTDGVGTKLILAFKADKHDTVGIDLVAMCVNDIIAGGAEPLFFLDYIAVAHNEPAKIESIVKGITDGCELAGCALVGGETAEMPDMYEDDHYDLAGFTVGCVEKSKIITSEKTKVGDVLIGLTSSGIHSNGYSLVRKICFKDNDFKMDQYFDELGDTLGNVLLTPTKIYVKPVLNVLKEVDVHGISHVTGGGFDENVPRCLNDGLGVEIDTSVIPELPVFDFLSKHGGIEKREMYNIFNMGIGMVLVVDEADVHLTLAMLDEAGETGYVIGKVTDEEGVKIV